MKRFQEGFQRANWQGSGWQVPAGGCVLLSAQDSPEQAGAGGAHGRPGRAEDGSQETSRYPKGDTAGGCLALETAQTWCHLRRSLSPVMREARPSSRQGTAEAARPFLRCRAMRSPSCLGLSPPRGRCFGDSASSSARGLQALLGGDTRQLRGLGASKRPRPHGPVPAPYGAGAQHDVAQRAGAAFHIPAASLEVQRRRLGSVPLLHPERREVWRLGARRPAGSWGSLSPRAPRASLQGAVFAYRALVPPKRSRPRGRIWFREHQ